MAIPDSGRGGSDGLSAPCTIIHSIHKIHCHIGGNYMKRFLFIFLALVMLLSVMPVSTYAAGNDTVVFSQNHNVSDVCPWEHITTRSSSRVLTMTPHDTTVLTDVEIPAGETEEDIRFTMQSGKTYFCLSFAAPSDFEGVVTEWIYQ